VQTTECCTLPFINKRSVVFFILFLSSDYPYTSSDKTIKLWKVFEKSLRVVSESNHYDGQRQLPTPSAPTHLRLPRMAQQDNIIAAVPRKVYSNAHAYHIHSISVNSDQETYISADDLRINLWNLNISDQSFSENFCSLLLL
jgi:serine/threonine-protein phosphatase 2A regulatory subunit B